jgi:predicted nucleotidyltransferase
LSESKSDILATIAYFDMFSYPLNSMEIFLFLGHVYDYTEFENSLEALVRDKAIYRFEEFYSLQNDPSLLHRRRSGNRHARELIKTAKKVAKILSWFPYVQGIAISGSLSKNFADEKSDIDLFIITTKNRLWIARTFMHCLKKLSFLFNKQHLFCMNYYIDEETLPIAEKNIYTAIEIATLIPLQGEVVFEQFYAANSWFRGYLPNKFLRVSSAQKIKRPLLKGLIEKIFDNKFGDMIDHSLMNITAKRWIKKTQQKKLNSNGIIMGMDATKHSAKPDPKIFQNKLMDMYKDKLSQIFKLYETKFSSAN